MPVIMQDSISFNTNMSYWFDSQFATHSYKGPAAPKPIFHTQPACRCIGLYVGKIIDQPLEGFHKNQAFEIATLTDVVNLETYYTQVPQITCRIDLSLIHI